MTAAGSVSLFFLFWLFCYIGLITIGGGLVGVTIMHQVIVESYHLITPEVFYNMVAISESTPGPIGVNMATYIGTELYGVAGGIVTTFGEVLPSLVIIMLVARFFMRFQEHQIVQAAFKGLRAATTGIIAVAAAQIFVIALLALPLHFEASELIKNMEQLFRWKNLIFYLICTFLLFKTKFHPFFVVLLGALYGILFC